MTTTLLSCLLCGGLEARLGKEIPVELLETPFSEAVEYIRQQSGLPIVLERRKLGKVLTSPVSFRAKSIPVREALKWVTRLAGADFEVGDRVVTVSTAHELMARRTEVAIYDVGDLVRERPPFPGPDYVALGAPPSVTFARERESAAFGMLILAALIQARVRPESWAPEYGTSIEAKGNLLIVVHTPEVHGEIERVLDEVRREATRMISVHVEEMVVPAPAVTRAVKESGAFVLTRGAADGLRKTAIGKRSASILCFDGQRSHSHGGQQRSILADFDVSGGTHDPDIRTMMSGLSADARPYLSGDGKSVMLEFRLSSCGPPEVLPFEPFEGMVAGGADKAMFVPGAIDLPRWRMITFRSILEIPFGRSALFSAGDGTRVFLVSAQVIQP